jgi:hypothetical protein
MRCDDYPQTLYYSITFKPQGVSGHKSCRSYHAEDIHACIIVLVLPKADSGIMFAVRAELTDDQHPGKPCFFRMAS